MCRNGVWDEKEIADLIELYLKNDGYTVYKFYNGIDALKCVENEELNLEDAMKNLTTRGAFLTVKNNL